MRLKNAQNVVRTCYEHAAEAEDEQTTGML